MPSPTRMNRRKLLGLFGSVIAAPHLAPRTALVQEAWPTRAVKYVNGFPAGGATDTLSRILCQNAHSLPEDERIVRADIRGREPHERDEFRRDVVVELEKYEVIGPGISGRVCSRLQREHINRPRTRWL